MPRTDNWQRDRLAAGLELLKASRLKDLDDAEIARLRAEKAALFEDEDRKRAELRAQEARWPGRRIYRVGDTIEEAIFHVQAKREDAVRKIEAAAAAVAQFVTEDITEAPAKAKHAGGRPPEHDWTLIDALTARDIYEDTLPETIAEMVRRIQAACRRQGIAEPCEETLKPKARVWFNVLWRGQPPCPAKSRARGKVVPLR